MSAFSPVLLHTLTDLFLASGGEVGQFSVITEDQLAIYEELLRYRLVTIESIEEDEHIRWTAALTEDGRRFFLEYNRLEENDLDALPRRDSFTLHVNRRDPDEDLIFNTLTQLQQDDTLMEKLFELIRLHEMIEKNDVQAFIAAYPNFAEALATHSAQPTQDQNQWENLLNEMKALKSLLGGQKLDTSPRQENPEPIKLPRPIIPAQAPEGAPKQLNVPQFEIPHYEEDSDSSELFVVRADLKAGKVAVENFLKSLKMLQEDTEK